MSTSSYSFVTGRDFFLVKANAEESTKDLSIAAKRFNGKVFKKTAVSHLEEFRTQNMGVH